MTSKKSNSLFAIAIFVVLVFCFGCELFTTSQFSNFRRDLSSTLDNYSKEELFNSIDDPNLRGDSEATKALLSALGKKDLSDIEPEDANALLALATDAILPINTLNEILGEFLTTESDKPEVTADSVLASIIERIPKVDTTAVNQILNNTTLLEDGDINLSAVSFASMAVIVGSFSNAGIATTEDFENVFGDLKDGLDTLSDTATQDDINNIIDQVLTNNDAGEISESIKAAFNAMIIISDKPNFNGDDFFGSFIKGLLN